MYRIALKIVALVAVIVALASAAGYVWLRGSLPRVDGTLHVAGFAARVDILRDRYAIPHIRAGSETDAWRALGYVHAQDRLWQMEMSRRIASGTLSEAFGAKTLDTDRFMRTLGVHRTALAIVRNLDAATRGRLEAYAAGVNAYVADHRGAWPIEFELTRVSPSRWEPADSIGWMIMMAWDLAGNWQQELLRMRLSTRLSRLQLAQFLPPYPGDRALPLPDLRALYGVPEGSPKPSASSFAPSDSEGIGSNNWVVSGARTDSGKPLLANDPHLGLTVPSTWYLAHLEYPGGTLVGGTLPGVPALILGHNGRIAWGLTNTNPDVQDLYLERLLPDDPSRYATPTGSAPFLVIPERIRVKGSDDVVLSVRVTRHGPVVSDVYAPAAELLPRGHVLSLAWTALDEHDQSLAALQSLGRATTWQAFTESLRNFGSPQQNIVYADVDGNVGFIAPGRVPVRSADNDLHGLAPAPGWDARYDWTGFVPFDALPRAFNPADGLIVTANQKIVPPDYPWFITAEWAPPYRAERIRTLLEALPRHSEASFRTIQADTVSLAARSIVPFVTSAAVATPEAKQAIDRLRRWDGEMGTASVEAQIFHAWLREFTRLLYADELGPWFDKAWDERAVFVDNVLHDRAGAARWCDDVTTPETETCASLVGRALERAVSELKRSRGADPNGWRWGEPHAAWLAHRPFDTVAGLRSLFDLNIAVPGDSYTVNVGRHRIGDPEPYRTRHAASLRGIYDLSDLNRSRFIHSTGQSGNRLSPHYADFLAPWARVEDVPISTDWIAAEKGALGRLVLMP